MSRRVIARIGAAGYEPPERTAADDARMAEIIATRTVPHGSTDAVFMEGRYHDDGLLGEGSQEYRDRYKRAIGSYPSGKKYMSQLARYPGDPRAWVDSLSDVSRICREDNLTWEYAGRIRHRAVERDEPDPLDKPYEVAPDLIEKRVRKAVKANPDLAHDPKALADTREKIKKAAVGATNDP